MSGQSLCGVAIGFRSPQLGSELDAAGKMAFARELGLAVIEPQCAPHELADPEAARAYGVAAQAAGVAVPSLGCPLPLSDDGGDLAAACAHAVAMARAVACDRIFAVVAKPPDRQEPQSRTWRRLAQRAAEACARLGDAGISLAIEPDHGAFVQNAERLEQLLDAVDDERLLVNFDACNLYLGGSDPLRALRRLAGRIRGGHIKDGVYRCGEWAECPVGEGELDWASILAAMADLGLRGPMFIEHCKTTAAVRAALEHIIACASPVLQ